MVKKKKIKLITASYLSYTITVQLWVIFSGDESICCIRRHKYPVDLIDLFGLMVSFVNVTSL